MICLICSTVPYSFNYEILNRFFYLPIVKEFPLEIESELVSIVVHVGFLRCCCLLLCESQERRTGRAGT
eukprot:SAG25_NODE_727_length_5698_cov_2.832649_7_plen_69_part_00